MKNIFKIFGFCSLCVLVLFLTTGDAYADDVLKAVRAKALSFLKDLRPVIFILAGFGLVGFAWMAIFNKISWKWFANIAMGLFLVANMGLFVDYFAGNDGQRKDLGYGNYMNQPDYISTSGTDSDPQSQKAENDGSVTGKEGGGETPNSDSDQLSGDDCRPPLVCEGGDNTPKIPDLLGQDGGFQFPPVDPINDAKTSESCEAAGGRWDALQSVCLKNNGGGSDGGAAKSGSMGEGATLDKSSGGSSSGVSNAAQSDNVSGSDTQNDSTAADSGTDGTTISSQSGNSSNNISNASAGESGAETGSGTQPDEAQASNVNDLWAQINSDNGNQSGETAGNNSSDTETSEDSGGSSQYAEAEENVSEAVSGNNGVTSDETAEEPAQEETALNCSQLENKCQMEFGDAMEICQDKSKSRPNREQWCEENPDKCSYQEGEYDTKATKPKDQADYKKYIDDLNQEKFDCEHQRLSGDTYVKVRDCPFDRTPSEDTYCERYPNRCEEVKTGSQQYSGMYPTEEGRKEYNVYRQSFDMESCRKAAYEAFDKCYAPCVGK